MTVTPIPGSIVKAVCAVMTTLDAVKKSQKNTHGGYMFSSTDDIYAAVTRKMGEVGLLVLPLEDGEPTIERIEKEGKTSQWLKIAYQFVLATEEATWTDAGSRRTLFIQITGPQTFQAAQSYLEKSYLRSLFKIPTGDMDLDSLPEGFEYHPVNSRPKNGNGALVPPSAPVEGKATTKKSSVIQAPTATFDTVSEVGTALQAAKSEDDVDEIWCEHMEAVCALGHDERSKADDLYESHMSRVKANGEAAHAA